MAMKRCYAFLVACQWLVALAADETGLVRLEQPEGTGSCSETYVCTTTGRSEVVLKFDGQVIFRRSHSQYVVGSGVNESVGDVTIGILSRSLEADVCHDVLRNTSDYCYKTMIAVRLTLNTACHVLECTTSTFIDNMNRELTFGNATIAENRPLPRPTGLRYTHLTVERVTFTWNQITVNCSTLGYHYIVSLTNCGSCPSKMDTTSNSVTCEKLIVGQTCSISLWGVTDCAASDPVSLSVQVPNPGNCSSSLQGVAQCTTSEPVTSEPDTSPMKGSDVGAIVGGVIGGAVGVGILAILIVAIVVIIVRKRNGGAYVVRKGRDDDSEKGEEMEILDKPKCKNPDTPEPDVSLDDGKDTPVVPMDQQALNGQVTAASIETPASTEPTTEAAQETTADEGHMIMATASDGMSGKRTDAPPVATTRGVSFSPSVFCEPTPFSGQAGSDMDDDVDMLNPSGYGKSSVVGLHEDSYTATDSDIKRLVPKSVDISEPSRESEPSHPVGINGRRSSQFPNVKPSSENPDVDEYVEQLEAKLLKRQDERFAKQDKKIANQDVKLKTLNTRVEELEARVETLTKERELLKSKCETIKQESDKKILQLTEERDILKSRCAEFEQKKEESASQLSELCQKLEELESKYVNLKEESDREIDALKQELDMKQDELNKATKELKQAQDRLQLTKVGTSFDSQNTATPSKPDFRKCKSVPANSTQ